ncbi:MAG: V-type ATP synthase subunit E [Halobaculum sp.]
MSLETVVEDIRTEARQRATEIREEAEREAEQIREEAREEADRIKEEARESVERRIEQEREQATSSATLEAKQERLSARRDILEQVHEETEQAIASMEGERRRSLTKSVIEDAAEEFGDEPVAVYGRADDRELILALLDEGGHDEWSFAGERDCLGGIVAESEASRVRVNNTFDSILEDAWEDNLKAISDRLFEDE